MSYDGSDSQAASPIEPSYQHPPRSPPPMQIPPPVEPLRLPPHRLSDSQIRGSTNPYPPRPGPMLDVRPRPNPASTITRPRVEFDPQMAYSPYGRSGNHSSIQDVTTFYNHAVASQLATSPSTSPSAPSNYRESRISSPYASEFPSTIHQGQVAAPSVFPHEQYASHLQGYRLSSPVPPPPPPPPPQSLPAFYPPGSGHVRSQSGFGRGPLPPVPGPNVPLSRPQWEESDPRLVQDAYVGHG